MQIQQKKEYCRERFHLKRKDNLVEITSVKADLQSVEFSERAEIHLFVGENVDLKFNRQLRLSNFL